MTQPPHDNAPDSDAGLLQRHLAGERAAFAQLVERYRRELFDFLSRLMGDAAAADDVFQETFLQIHMSAAAFDPARPLKPWLFTIAANKARDAMRHRSRRQAVSLDAAVSASDPGATYADIMPSDIPAPEAGPVNLETRRSVERIVERMPENLRAVLLLSYFHGMPYQDIAEILGLPVGTVKSRLHAAVKHFAREWQVAAGKPKP